LSFCRLFFTRPNLLTPQSKPGEGKKGARKKDKEREKKLGQDGSDYEDDGILTEEQRRLLEEKIKKDEMKLAADLFGSEVGGNILDIQLNTETDFMSYAQVVSTKLKNPKNRRFLVSFFSTLMEITSDDM
jgi:hypothetical protein